MYKGRNSNNNPNVSVIVPVYNVEHYLKKCIDSLLSQSFDDFEIILINDGSTDNSASICEEYALNNPRIRLFHQKNTGASAARNLGIDNACGEYICFVDSDDWVESNYLSDFFNIKFKKENKLMIIQTNIFYEYADEPKKSNWHSVKYPQDIYTDDEIINALMLSDFLVKADGGPVGKLFQRELLNQYNIRFSTKISAYEDVIFCLKYISNINYLYISDGRNYHYMHRFSNISLSKKIHPYYEYKYSAKEGKNVINYLFDRFIIRNTDLKLHALTKMLEIELSGIYSLYRSKPLISRSSRLSFLSDIKNDNVELLCKYYKPKNIRGILTKYVLLINSISISDFIFYLIYKFIALIKR
jgi:glycosyltransferase involved in cell wall biosynthesis